MVGPGGQHHGEFALTLHLVQHLLAQGLELVPEGILGAVARLEGPQGIGLRDLEFFLHVLLELLFLVLHGVPVEHGVVVGDAPQLFRVVGVADDQGVALHHGAHGLAGLFRVLRGHGGDHRHEDAVHALFGQVAQMAVDQLGGEAHRVRGDGGDATLVDLPGAGVGEPDGEAQGPEEGAPEGHGLPEGEDPGDADGDAPVLDRLRTGVVLEEELLPLPEQVGHGGGPGSGLTELPAHILILGVAQNLAPLTAVVGDPGAAVGEAEDGPLAVVGAEGAGGVLLLAVGEVVQLLQVQEGPVGGVLLIPLPGDEGHADGTHEAGIGGTEDLTSGILLHGPEDGVVFKGAALDHDLVPQGVQVGKADDLGKDVFDDGAAQAGHDVLGAAAVALLGDDAAVHKDGAAAAQHRRVLGGEGGLLDALGGDAQGGGEVLQKGAAAGGAGLIDQDIGDDALVQPHGLHVLAADVQDEGGVGHVLLGRPGVGHRLHRVVLRLESLGEEHLAVAGGARRQDM